MNAYYSPLSCTRTGLRVYPELQLRASHVFLGWLVANLGCVSTHQSSRQRQREWWWAWMSASSRNNLARYYLSTVLENLCFPKENNSTLHETARGLLLLKAKEKAILSEVLLRFWCSVAEYKSASSLPNSFAHVWFRPTSSPWRDSTSIWVYRFYHLLPWQKPALLRVTKSNHFSRPCSSGEAILKGILVPFPA